MDIPPDQGRTANAPVLRALPLRGNRSSRSFWSGTPTFTILAILSISCCQEVSSYGRPAVVQVDWKSPFITLHPDSHQGRQFTALKVNQEPLICGDLSVGATRLQLPSIHPDQWEEVVAGKAKLHENIIWEEPPGGPRTQWNRLEYRWTPETQTLRYLMMSKLIYLMEKCFLFELLSDRFWVYDVCIGRTIGQYHQSRQLSFRKGSYNNLGYYDGTLDEVYANGTIVQHYVGGTDGRSTRITLECGTKHHPTIHSISEVEPLKYEVIFRAPSFCDWRTDTSDKLDPAQLLYGLERWCSNFTDGGWWTYEYCHPDSLIQYHLDNDGSIDRKHVYYLGILRSFGSSGLFDQAAVAVPSIPSPLFTNLRSPHIIPPQPSEPIQWPSLPLSFAKVPSLGSHLGYPKVSVLDIPLKALKLEMGNGTSCGKGLTRQATVYFVCPPDVEYNPVTQILHLRETNICRYEMVVQTPLICAHPQLLPQRTPKPETVLCYPMEHELTTQLKPSGRPYDYRPGRHPDIHELLRSQFPEDVEHHRYMRVSTSPEMLPASFTLEDDDVAMESPDTTPRGLFGLGDYVRRRPTKRSDEGVELVEGLPLEHPKFRVGDVVRHTKLDVRAAVAGWDRQVRAPPRWIAQLKASTTILKDEPFYLLLLDEANMAGKLPPSSIFYAPQVELVSDEGPIQNRYWDDYFEGFDHTTGRYILSKGRDRYPDDVAANSASDTDSILGWEMHKGFLRQGIDDAPETASEAVPSRFEFAEKSSPSPASMRRMHEQPIGEDESEVRQEGDHASSTQTEDDLGTDPPFESLEGPPLLNRAADRDEL